MSRSQCNAAGGRHEIIGGSRLAACAALSRPPAPLPRPRPTRSTPSSRSFPPPSAQKRIEDGARTEGKLVLIHTMRGNLERRSRRAVQEALSIPQRRARRRHRLAGRRRAALCRGDRRAPSHRRDQHRAARPHDARRQEHGGALPDARSRGAAAALPGFIDPESRWTPWYWSEHGISYNSAPRAEGQGADAVERPVQSVLQGQRLVRSGRGPLSLRPLRHHGRGGDREARSNASATTIRSSSAATPSASS